MSVLAIVGNEGKVIASEANPGRLASRSSRLHELARTRKHGGWVNKLGLCPFMEEASVGVVELRTFDRDAGEVGERSVIELGKEGWVFATQEAVLSEVDVTVEGPCTWDPGRVWRCDDHPEWTVGTVDTVAAVERECQAVKVADIYGRMRCQPRWMIC